MSTNPLWDRIQKYMDDPSHRYPPLAADLARDSGVSEQVLSKWKAKPVFPRPMHLMAFAAGTGIPYEELLLAVLQGNMYLPPADTSAKVVLNRRWKQLYKKYGLRFVDDLKSEGAAEKPPVDLSDIFAENELEGTAPPRWSVPRPLSALPDTTDDLIAADEQAQPISAEHEESEHP